MAEEEDGLDLDLDELDQDIENRNKVEERIRDLSKKVKLTSGERDEFKKLNTELKTQNEQITKERDFLESFTDVTSRYPGAQEYRDAIRDKVLSGYTAEDAAAAILAKEGKLGIVPEPPEGEEKKPESPAGGSAPNQLKQEENKPPGKMNLEELREAITSPEVEQELNRQFGI
jgi:hypothetical protein